MLIPPIPVTAKEALSLWDNNDQVVTLEMEGLGPGHEQRIHMAVFELIREFFKHPLPIEMFSYNLLDPSIDKIDHELNLQLTHQQKSYARFLAFHFIYYGFGATLKTYQSRKRFIVVSQQFPVKILLVRR